MKKINYIVILCIVIFFEISCSYNEIPTWVVGEYKIYGINNFDSFLNIKFSKNDVLFSNSYKNESIKVNKVFIEKKTDNYFVFSINAENLFFLGSNNLFYFMTKPKKLYFFISKEIENDWEYYNYVTEQNITEQSVFEKKEKNPILFRIVVTDSPTYDAVIRCNKGFLIRN